MRRPGTITAWRIRMSIAFMESGSTATASPGASNAGRASKSSWQRSKCSERPVFCGTAATARRPAFWNAVISINNFLYFFLIYIYPRALRALRSLPGSPGSRLRSLRSLPGSPGLSVRALPGSPGLSARSFYPGLSIFVIAVFQWSMFRTDRSKGCVRTIPDRARSIVQ